MTFSRKAAAKIEIGRKTATTRVSGRYQVGRVYAINPYPATNPKARFDKAVGYIRILRKLTGNPVSIAYALWDDEGFDSSGDCKERFRELGLLRYGRVYIYRFEYVGKSKNNQKPVRAKE